MPREKASSKRPSSSPGGDPAWPRMASLAGGPTITRPAEQAQLGRLRAGQAAEKLGEAGARRLAPGQVAGRAA